MAGTSRIADRKGKLEACMQPPDESNQVNGNERIFNEDLEYTLVRRALSGSVAMSKVSRVSNGSSLWNDGPATSGCSNFLQPDSVGTAAACRKPSIT